jgi:hypothetical protein
MNRLQLAQRLRKEAGIGGSGPTSTLVQTGEYAMVVEWVDTAYRDVLNMHDEWLFLRSVGSFALTGGTDLADGTERFTPTALGLTDFKAWIKDDARCYLTALGTIDEQEIFWVPWDEFRRSYMFGAARADQGRPLHFTIAPDKSLVFWPAVSGNYTMPMEYYRAGVAMTLDESVPVFPDYYHMIIVWRALIYYAASYAEADKYAHAQNEYRRLKREMELKELPQMGWGDPLC